MHVYRIAKTQCIDDLTEMGARLYAGKWNHKGIGVLTKVGGFYDPSPSATPTEE